jgi:protein SCO1/2
MTGALVAPRTLAALLALSALLWLPRAPGAAPPAAFRGGEITPPRAAPELLLRDPDGGDFRLSRERGRVVLLFFGYTLCPDVCPATLVELVQLRARLGEDAGRVRIVFVTVDPERDTPARLREYAQAFGGAFTALTGSPGALADVRRAYGVGAERRSVPGTGAGYLVDHSAMVYVVDPAGRLRLLFPFGTLPDDMEHDVRLLLRR